MIVAGRTIEVLAVDGRAITEVRIGPPADHSPPGPPVGVGGDASTP